MSAPERLEATDPLVLTFPTVASKEKTKRAFRIVHRDGAEKAVYVMDLDAFVVQWAVGMEHVAALKFGRSAWLMRCSRLLALPYFDKASEDVEALAELRVAAALNLPPHFHV